MEMISNPAFFENLASMSFVELTSWLNRVIYSVHVQDEALEELYEEFIEAVDMTEETAASYSAQDRERLLSNAKVYGRRGKYALFQAALVAVKRPRPRVFLRTDVSKPVEISKAIYSQRITQVIPLQVIQNSNGDKITKQVLTAWQTKVKDYIDKIDSLCKNYQRVKFHEFIRTGERKQGSFYYKIPTRKKLLEGLDINTVLAHLDGYKMVRDKAYEEKMKVRDEACFELLAADTDGNPTWIHGEVKALSEFGISRPALQRFRKCGNMKKEFFIRLAFALGLEDALTEELLLKEGFSIETSINPADRLYYNCLRIGFPFEYADELGKRKGFPSLIPNKEHTKEA